MRTTPNIGSTGRKRRRHSQHNKRSIHTPHNNTQTAPTPTNPRYKTRRSSTIRRTLYNKIHSPSVYRTMRRNNKAHSPGHLHRAICITITRRPANIPQMGTQKLRIHQPPQQLPQSNPNNPRFRILTAPLSQFPIPNSRFPVSNSQFPNKFSISPKKHYFCTIISSHGIE